MRKNLNINIENKRIMTYPIHITPANSGAICTVDIFGEAGLKNTIKKLGWKIKNHVICDVKEKPIKCSICSDKLTVSNLSAFFPSSLDQVCDKPDCFIKAISKAKKYEK